MAAITAEQRAELVALFLTMFGQAPTTTQLARMVTARENGTSLLNIAISASVILEDEYALVASMDADTFADYLADSLLADDVPASAREWAENWVVTNVNGNKSKQQVIVEAVQAIRATTNPNYASSQAELTADVEAALDVIDNVVPDELSFSLTADTDDSFNGGIGNDSVTGLLTNLQTGDVVKLGAGDDTITVSGDGATGIAEVDSANFDIRLVANSTINATLFTNVDEISINSSSISGTTLTVNNASFATTYEIAAAGKNTGLTVDFLDSSGSADTAQLALAGTGIKSSAGVITDTAVNISDTNTVEAATISTTGSNYVDLTGGTALKTITVTGDGSNYIDVVSSATSTTLDASAATGLLDLDFGSGLSDGDVLKAGAGTTDKLTATVSTTASNAPTIEGFETLALTLSAAVNLDLENTTGATTITLADSSANQRLSNIPVSVTAISTQESSASTTDLRFDYADDAAATLALSFAPTSASTAAVAWDDITLSNVKDLTLSASGAFASTIDDVAAGDEAESLTIKTSSSTGDFNTGTITADELVSAAIAAVAGDVTVEGITVGEATLESLTIDASDEANVTITNTITTYNATDDESSLKVVSIKGGDESVITTNGTFITANGAVTDAGEDVAITVALGEDSGGSDIGTMAVIGVESIDISLAENAGIASEIGLITANTQDVGNINVTVDDDAILEWDGVTATAGDIGNITVTTTGSGAVSNIAGGDVAVTATAGDIGDITLSSGDGGTIEIDVDAVAGSIGDVSITSKASDVITLDAADSLGDVTASVTTGDLLTLSIVDGGTLDTGNITVTGAGDMAITVDATATGNITVTSSNTDDTVDLVINLSAADSAGAVSVTGGAGDDTITAPLTSASTLNGGGGVDTITGSSGADTINGGAGNDTIDGEAGADVITTGTGTDTVNISAFADTGAVTNWTDTSGGSTVSTSGLKKIGVTAADNDLVDLTFLAANTFTAQNDTVTQVTDGSALGQTDDITTYTGTYDSATNTFTSTALASATDLLVVYDDGNGGGTFRAIVLVGVTAVDEANAGQGDLTV